MREEINLQELTDAIQTKIESEMRQKIKKEEPGPSFSKWIVSLVILLNTIFAGIVLYIFLTIGSEPMALIGAWFAFTTGELWLLSSIKKKDQTIQYEKLEDDE